MVCKDELVGNVFNPLLSKHDVSMVVTVDDIVIVFNDEHPLKHDCGSVETDETDERSAVGSEVHDSNAEVPILLILDGRKRWLLIFDDANAPVPMFSMNPLVGNVFNPLFSKHDVSIVIIDDERVALCNDEHPLKHDCGSVLIETHCERSTDWRLTHDSNAE